MIIQTRRLLQKTTQDLVESCNSDEQRPKPSRLPATRLSARVGAPPAPPVFSTTATSMYWHPNLLKAFILIASSALVACNDQAYHEALSNENCTPSGSSWIKGAIEPPNRVLAFEVIVNESDALLDGRRVDDAELIKRLKESRNLRPSPYVILAKSRNTQCARLTSLTRTIHSEFNCAQNYCLYKPRENDPASNPQQ